MMPGAQPPMPAGAMADVSNQGVMNAGLDFNPAVSNAAAGGPRQQQPPQQKVVWRGVLEWVETSKPPAGPGMVNKTTKQLTATFSVAPGEPDLNTSRWPQRLVMQMLPNSMLQSVSELFRNSRTVAIVFDNHDAETVQHLYRLLTSGNAACINIPPAAQSDIRVLMVLYSSRRRSFVGLIPTDQTQFINAIRTLIQNQRKKQMAAAGAGAQSNMMTMGGESMPQQQADGMAAAPQQQLGIEAATATAATEVKPESTTTLAATATNALASSTTATTTLSGAEKSSAKAAATGTTDAAN